MSELIQIWNLKFLFPPFYTNSQCKQFTIHLFIFPLQYSVASSSWDGQLIYSCIQHSIIQSTNISLVLIIFQVLFLYKLYKDEKEWQNLSLHFGWGGRQLIISDSDRFYKGNRIKWQWLSGRNTGAEMWMLSQPCKLLKRVPHTGTTKHQGPGGRCALADRRQATLPRILCAKRTEGALWRARLSHSRKFRF